jgi:hypothetical protein
MAGREVGLDIPGLEAQLGLTDATVNLSSDRSATRRRLGQSRLKLSEQLLECDLVRSHKRIHVWSSLEGVKELRRGGMSWREMRAQHDCRIELAQGLERGPKGGPVDRGHPGTIDARPKPLPREQIIGG